MEELNNNRLVKLYQEFKRTIFQGGFEKFNLTIGDIGPINDNDTNLFEKYRNFSKTKSDAFKKEGVFETVYNFFF